MRKGEPSRHGDGKPKEKAKLKMRLWKVAKGLNKRVNESLEKEFGTPTGYETKWYDWGVGRSNRMATERDW